MNSSKIVKNLKFIFSLKVVNILNLFITYGDTFLSTPSSYDELFYEIIRMRLIFTNLNAMGMDGF